MGEKLKELGCDPLKCLGAFCVINFFMFGICASGYWALDSKMSKVLEVSAKNDTQIMINTRRLDVIEQVMRERP